MLFLGGTGTYQQCLFDFDTETVVENTAPHNLADHQQYNATDRMVERGVVKYPNGWYRLYLIIDAPNVIAGNGYGVGLAKDPATSKSVNQTDDGPYDGTEAIYVWGLNRCDANDVDSSNVPQETHLSSYIRNLKVSASEATRTPDTFTSTQIEVLDRDNGKKPAFYTKSGLTAFVRGTNQPNPPTYAFRFFEFTGGVTAGNADFSITANSSGTKIGLFQSTHTSHPEPQGMGSGNTSPNTTLGLDNRIAVRYQTDNARVYLNGEEGPLADSSLNDGIDTRSSTRLCIGANGGASGVGTSRLLNGTIQRLTFWKTPFLDSKLDKLTTAIT